MSPNLNLLLINKEIRQWGCFYVFGITIDDLCVIYRELYCLQKLPPSLWAGLGLINKWGWQCGSDTITTDSHSTLLQCRISQNKHWSAITLKPLTGEMNNIDACVEWRLDHLIQSHRSGSVAQIAEKVNSACDKKRGQNIQSIKLHSLRAVSVHADLCQLLKAPTMGMWVSLPLPALSLSLS